MAKVDFRLVMPERELLAVDADMVVVPGSEGDFGVLPGHAPLISTVRPGVLEVFQGGKAEARFLVVGGFAEVTGTRCTVLAEEAMALADVSADQLAEREKTAERDLAEAGDDAARARGERGLSIARELRRAQAYALSRA